MADQIELRGLVASGYCGVLQEEQSRAQPLEVDLDVVLDLPPNQCYEIAEFCSHFIHT